MLKIHRVRALNHRVCKATVRLNAQRGKAIVRFNLFYYDRMSFSLTVVFSTFTTFSGALAEEHPSDAFFT